MLHSYPYLLLQGCAWASRPPPPPTASMPCARCTARCHRRGSDSCWPACSDTHSSRCGVSSLLTVARFARALLTYCGTTLLPWHYLLWHCSLWRYLRWQAGSRSSLYNSRSRYLHLQPGATNHRTTYHIRPGRGPPSSATYRGPTYHGATSYGRSGRARLCSSRRARCSRPGSWGWACLGYKVYVTLFTLLTRLLSSLYLLSCAACSSFIPSRFLTLLTLLTLPTLPTMLTLPTMAARRYAAAPWR